MKPGDCRFRAEDRHNIAEKMPEQTGRGKVSVRREGSESQSQQGEWSLFLQHQLAFISDQGLQFFRELCQQPWQGNCQTNVIVPDVDRAIRHLTESTHAELQTIPRPDLLLDRKHVVKSRGHAAKAGFQAPDRFLLS